MSKSDLLFLVSVASIPIQLNKFFFPDYSFVFGLPVDYRGISIYLSHIAIVLYLVAFVLENLKNHKKIFQRLKLFALVLFLFNSYLFISSAIFSVSNVASLIYNIKILTLSLFSYAAAITLSKKPITKPLITVIKLSVFWESALVVAQFLLQRSLNLWLIGERSFDVSTPGIAHSQLFGSQILRPYGTFPHPNVLAAYLVISLIILGSDARRQFLATAALILTFSRSAYLVAASAILASTRKVQYLAVELALAAAAALFLTKQLLTSQLSSVAERLLLIQSALDISLKNPLFGVGSNNFILELSKLDLTSLSQTRLLQPVHNVFLLIATENGIVGLLLFTAVLFVASKHVNSKTKALLFIALLAFSSIDHFLWTLHQGQMMLFLILAYIVSKKQSTKKGV